MSKVRAILKNEGPKQNGRPKYSIPSDVMLAANLNIIITGGRYSVDYAAQHCEFLVLMLWTWSIYGELTPPPPGTRNYLTLYYCHPPLSVSQLVFLL